MPNDITVIDLFAGPGGLGEGFSTFDEPGYTPFRIRLSIEKDPFAHKTLRLRSFFRQFPKNEAPSVYYEILREEGGWQKLPSQFSSNTELMKAWIKADQEAMLTELGSESHGEVRERITRILGKREHPWVLIGGPPCQAYSIVGRSRNKGIANYTIEADQRSTLYEEYLKIIAEHRPTIFVMENVTGMLSATVEKKKIFETILADLHCPSGEKSDLRYRVVPVVSPEEPGKFDDDDPRRFIVDCEDYGVPQQRHRVILIGVLDSLKDVTVPPLDRTEAPTVYSMINSLPRVRSGLSRSRQGNKFVALKDDAKEWQSSIHRQLGVNGYGKGPAWLAELDKNLQNRIKSFADKIICPQKDRGGEFISTSQIPDIAPSLSDFVIDERLAGVCNHSTRGHMDTDLVRYYFAAVFGKEHGKSPRLNDFPDSLLPKHKNAKSGHFNDRFRVQLGTGQATTITSHIAKDGHNFIHYDPTQCRSLTVREAARLQTFPDNYFFCGPRTQQYSQVGNAVPPWIARQIARSIWKTLVDANVAEK